MSYINTSVLSIVNMLLSLSLLASWDIFIIIVMSFIHVVTCVTFYTGGVPVEEMSDLLQVKRKERHNLSRRHAVSHTLFLSSNLRMSNSCLNRVCHAHHFLLLSFRLETAKIPA